MILSPYSNTMILSPFDIKGKGQIKTKKIFFFSCRKKSSVDMMCNEVTMLPLSSCWIFKHIFQWSTWLYDLCYHQGLILTSMIQTSGFTYVTQVPNQVGLQIWKSPYMTEYFNFYIIGLNMTFFINYRNDLYNQDQRFSSMRSDYKK